MKKLFCVWVIVLESRYQALLNRLGRKIPNESGSSAQGTSGSNWDPSQWNKRRDSYSRTDLDNLQSNAEVDGIDVWLSEAEAIQTTYERAHLDQMDRLEIAIRRHRVGRRLYSLLQNNYSNTSTRNFNNYKKYPNNDSNTIMK